MRVLQRLSDDRRHRIERERGHEHADGHDAACHERIAPECATLGDAGGEQHREGRSREGGAKPQAGLRDGHRPQQCDEPRVRQATRTDGEALREQVQEAECADGDHRAGAERALRDRDAGEARDKQDRERDEPRATVRDDLDQRGCIGVAGIVAEPCDAEDAVLQRIPRGGDESERADGEPASREPARASHRGAELISFSQRSSRRLRSADEPYFAKS